MEQENEVGQSSATDDNTETNVKTEEEDEWMDILGSGQLKKKIINPASDGSVRPERSHICKVSFEGKIADGTVVEKHDSFHFQIGDGEVIQGLDLTIPLMYVGEVALVEVGPRFAYGSRGRAPDIKPDQTLYYTVELLSAEPEPDIEALSVSQRKKIGNRKRERGNWWYSRQEHILAIQCYRRALEYLDDVEGGIIIQKDNEEDKKPVDEELLDLLEDRMKVYNNLAAAQMMIKAYDTALQSVENVLSCQPKNVKALFRKGRILAEKGQFADAAAVLRKASELEPDMKLIRQELNKVLGLLKADTKQETNLYKKMLGHGKEKTTAGSPTKQNTLYPWAAVVCGTAVLVAGMIAYRFKYL